MAFNEKPLGPPAHPTCAASLLQTFLAQYSALKVCYSDVFGLEVGCFYLENKWWIVSIQHQPQVLILILNANQLCAAGNVL